MSNAQPVVLPDAYLDLLDAPVVGVLTTFGPDAPHAAPVWFCRDGNAILVSTRSGRQKHRNLVRDARVSFLVVDPSNTMRYVELRGTAALADDPTYETRDRVVQKHGYPDGSAFDPPGAGRLTIRLVAHRVIEH